MGPFRASLDLLATGVVERHGIGHVAFGGYPEGHPAIDAHALDAALQAKVALARQRGLGVSLVTQFGFEAEPILRWIAAQRARGIDCPVHVGVAGPATVATLAKFAIRCGIGASLRALARGHTAFARIMAEAGPDRLIDELVAGESADWRRSRACMCSPSAACAARRGGYARLDEVVRDDPCHREFHTGLPADLPLIERRLCPIVMAGEKKRGGGGGPAIHVLPMGRAKELSRETPRGAPLSHHRAYGSRTTAVSGQVERGVMVGHRSQSQRRKRLRDGHRLFDLRGISQAPPSFAGRRQLDGADARHTMTHQKVDHGADALAALQP